MLDGGIACDLQDSWEERDSVVDYLKPEFEREIRVECKCCGDRW